MKKNKTRRDGRARHPLLIQDAMMMNKNQEEKKVYINEPSTTWSIRFMFIFGGESLRKVIFDHYIIAGLSSVLVADTLVEGPGKDG
jgi:hypothetical protein